MSFHHCLKVKLENRSKNLQTKSDSLSKICMKYQKRPCECQTRQRAITSHQWTCICSADTFTHTHTLSRFSSGFISNRASTVFAAAPSHIALMLPMGNGVHCRSGEITFYMHKNFKSQHQRLGDEVAASFQKVIT